VAIDPLITLRVDFAPGVRLGPGKADLLEGIRDTGSIAAAGRRMGMSYKRAWMLVEEMNAAFSAPLVSSARGGPGGGGAQLTETGATVLRLYREVISHSEAASADPLAALESMLRDRTKVELSGGK